MGTPSSSRVPGHRRGPALRRLAWLGFALAVTLAGCAKKDRDNPTAPGTFSLRGRVRLTGFTTDARGVFTGTRVADDATGIEVDLAYGKSIVARTTTVNGVYQFSGLAPGGYQAQAELFGVVSDHTNLLTIVDHDLEAGDMLNLVSRGDILPCPNPSPDTVWVLFDVPDSEYVVLRIREMGGASTRLLAADFLKKALTRAMWDGRDESGHPATGSLYWVTFESGIDVRAQLLFRR